MQELLSKAHTVELQKEKEEKRIARALDEKFPSKAPGEVKVLPFHFRHVVQLIA